MTEWKVTFVNASLVPWVCVLWGELPDTGLTPVSWQQSRVLPAEMVDFPWDDAYAVTLATFEEGVPTGIYTPEPPSWRDALPSSTWDAITINQVDYLAEVDHGGPEGPIGITNRSTGPVNAGLVRSGSALVYSAELPVEKDVVFALEPRFRLGLFAEMRVGQIIDPALVIVGPAPLTFPQGVSVLIATAVQQGQTVSLTVVPGG